jgi:Protein of unknown function (DUF3089)
MKSNFFYFYRLVFGVLFFSLTQKYICFMYLQFVRILLGTFFLISMLHCTVHPKKAFEPRAVPAAPDYRRMETWAAHPDASDPADQTPCPDIKNEQASAAADVFFLHPTTYTGSKRNQRAWNADLADAELNRATDESAVLFQASIFNGAGRVFAPRYRQGHLDCFYGSDKNSAKFALELAYADVKAAFEHYLKNWNRGRPFIIAGHSQGALHAMYLLRDVVENTPLQKQLAAAYVVGYPLPKDFLKQIKPCENPEETGCVCSWRTWERDYGRRKAFETNMICTNPISWTTAEGVYAPKTASLGGVVRPFCRVYPQLSDAEVYKGIVLCSKPKFAGSALFTRKNYHIGDLNLYYMDVRENARRRVDAFLKKQQ